MSTPSTPNAMRNGTNSTVLPAPSWSWWSSQDRAPVSAPAGTLACHRGAAGVDLRGGVGRGEAVEHLVAAGRARRGQRGDLRRGHPAVGGLADRPGDADHGQGRAAGQVRQRQHVADLGRRSAEPAVGVQHDLAGAGHPPPLDQRDRVDRAARVGPPDHGHRRQRSSAVVDRGDRRGRERAGRRGDPGRRARTRPAAPRSPWPRRTARSGARRAAGRRPGRTARCEATISEPPSTAAVTAIITTSPITTVCTRRRPTPERTTRPSALIGAGSVARCRRRPGRRRAGRCGSRTTRPGPGRG